MTEELKDGREAPGNELLGHAGNRAAKFGGEDAGATFGAGGPAFSVGIEDAP